MEHRVGVALLGCGTVGGAVMQRLLDERHALEQRSGVRYDVIGVSIRDAQKPRPFDLSGLIRPARVLAGDPNVDVLIECIGGTGEACEHVERALERGCHVITANKDLIAQHGPRLHALAAASGASLRYEASVCGAIPILRAIDDALAADRVHAISGVMNGTCTAILSAMEDGASYDEALRDAQAQGFAEADPSNDVDGIDAAHKLAILIQRAFNVPVTTSKIVTDGIRHIGQREIARARMLGYRVRLIAAARCDDDGVAAMVTPALVPQEHPFATLRGPENIVHILADDAGALTLRGRGAGGAPTASAVLADLVATLRGIAERRDVRAGRESYSLLPEIAPLVSALSYHRELPRIPLWDDL